MTVAGAESSVGAAKLAYLQSKKIVVVDDAFDPPEMEDLDPSDVADFIAECEGNAAFREELASVLGVEAPVRVEITPDAVRKLWSARSADHGVISAAKNTLFADALDRLSNVTPFCDHLRELGFDLVEVGQAGAIPAGNIGLVLVDYVLGREATSGGLAEALDLKTEATKRSEAVAERFYRQFTSDSDRPFIVLMSSHPKGDVLLERFREGAKLIGGLFDFVSKKDLCHLSTLEFKLRIWNYSLPARHDIQHFVEGLSTAMGEIVDSFMKSVMSLSFEDYAYIQRLALQEDGHPLGDYMLWLYSAQLSDLLLTHPLVTKQRVKLDAMELNLLPTQQPPSANVAGLYRAAVSLPVPDGTQAHPRESDPAESPMPYLRLGHVFVNAATRSVRMVLNASCDLAFAPHSKRRCEPDQSILFIPGTLVPLYEPIGNMSLPRTELFDVAGVLYRVVWQTDRVFSSPHRVIGSQMASEGYELTSQLRLPFALQVQQAFAAGLTRIGLPVPPPICVSVAVDLYCVGDDGAARLLAPTINDGAFVVHRKVDRGFVREFVLTPKAIETFLGQSEELAEQQLRVPAVAPPALSPPPATQPGVPAPEVIAAEEKRVTRLQKKADLVRASDSRHDFWFSLVSELRQLPASGENLDVEAGFLRITCDVGRIGPWKGNPIIVMNLLYEQEPNKDSRFEEGEATAEEPTAEDRGPMTPVEASGEKHDARGNPMLGCDAGKGKA